MYKTEIFATYLVVNFVISVPLNIVLLLVLSKNQLVITKRLRLILLNIPICHLVQLIGVFPLLIASGFKRQWMFGKIGCNYMAVVSGTCGFTTIFINMLLCGERYVSIAYSFTVNSKFNTSRTIKLTLSAWLFSILLSSFPVMGWSSYELEPLKTHCGPNWQPTNNSRSYMLFLIFLAFLLPQLLIAFFTYKFLKTVKNMQQSFGLPRHSKLIFWFVIFSIILFDLLWLPYVVCGLLTLSNISVPPLLIEIAGSFAKLTVLSDVIVFIILNKHCRHSIKQLFVRSVPSRCKEIDATCKHHLRKSSRL